MNSNEMLATRLQMFFMRKDQEGFFAWGSNFDDPKYLVKTKVGETGCTSSTCNHNSHDPLSDDLRFTPYHDGDNLSFVGSEDRVDYWILSNKRGHAYRAYEILHDGAYYDSVKVGQLTDIPDYLLAGSITD